MGIHNSRLHSTVQKVQKSSSFSVFVRPYDVLRATYNSLPGPSFSDKHVLKCADITYCLAAVTSQLMAKVDQTTSDEAG